jgi:hypothetical protein
MPRHYALIVAPFIGRTAGAILIAFTLPVRHVALIFVLQVLTVVLLYTYGIVAVVCVPIMFIAAKLRKLSPLIVYLTAAFCALPLSVWAFLIDSRSPFGYAGVVVGIVAAISFNAIFFRRIAL